MYRTECFPKMLDLLISEKEINNVWFYRCVVVTYPNQIELYFHKLLHYMFSYPVIELNYFIRRFFSDSWFQDFAEILFLLTLNSLELDFWLTDFKSAHVILVLIHLLICLWKPSISWSYKTHWFSFEAHICEMLQHAGFGPLQS